MLWRDGLDPERRDAAGRRVAELGAVQLAFRRGVLVLLDRDLHARVRAWPEVTVVGGVTLPPGRPGGGPSTTAVMGQRAPR